MILYELVGLTHSFNTLPKFTTDVATPFLLLSVLMYHIEQNFGGKKFWRNSDFETLAEKTLANPRLACIFVLHRECWRKKLGELWRFAKFAKVFSPPKFCSIQYLAFLAGKPKLFFKILLFESSSGNNSASSTILTPLIFTKPLVSF